MAVPTRPLNIRVTGSSPTGLIDASIITYLGCFRMPGAGSGVDLNSTNGGLGARWVTVGGVPELHFFLLAREGVSASAGILSAASTTVFTLNSAGAFAVGQKVNIVRAANGTNLPENRTITNISSNTVTVTPALGGTPVFGDQVYRDQSYFCYEVKEPATFATDYTVAPRATIYATWPDIFQGHRVTWRNGILTAPMQYLYPTGLYWHEGNQLLYWGYYDAYNGSTGFPDWGLGATALLNPATGQMTSYGPWRVKATDSNGANWYGPARQSFLSAGPTGDMGGVGAAYGDLQMSWGPSFYAGVNWPTAATPSGLGAADLVLADRYLNYYYPGGAFNTDGSPTGPVRQFQYPTSPNRNYPWENVKPVPNFANPALNGGRNTWPGTKNGSTNGALWLSLTHRRGVLFIGSLVGSADQDPTHLRAAHFWYTNSGSGRVSVIAPTGTFQQGETITGGTSGKTGTVNNLTTITGGKTLWWGGAADGTSFLNGETITGGTSGAHGVVSDSRNFVACDHGFNSGAPNTPSIAGPVATQSFPALIIYDPVALAAAKNVHDADWQQTPTSWIDLETTYGIRTQPVVNPNGTNGLVPKNVAQGYWDATRNRWYVVANQADYSAPYDQSSPGPLIHVFQIADTP